MIAEVKTLKGVKNDISISPVNFRASLVFISWEKSATCYHRINKSISTPRSSWTEFVLGFLGIKETLHFDKAEKMQGS